MRLAEDDRESAYVLIAIAIRNALARLMNAKNAIIPPRVYQTHLVDAENLIANR
jgi:hypothetical protein